MLRIKLALYFLVLGIQVALRRLFRGRRRPSWTWMYETIVELIGRLGRRLIAMGVREMRKRIERAARIKPRVLRKVRSEPVDVNGVAGEWIVPTGASPLPVILYLHGGGYVLCSINTHRPLIAGLTLATQARALAINYRLAPEHPFPAAVDDAVAAYRWLLAHDVTPNRVVFAGDSAGGGLSLAAMLALRDAGDPLPAAGVLISPWVDLSPDGESISCNAEFDYMGGHVEALYENARMYLGDADPRNPLISPVHGDLKELPPLLVHVGGAEILLGQVTRLAERLQVAGNEVSFQVWDDMVHVWHAFGLPESRRAVKQIGQFIRDRTC